MRSLIILLVSGVVLLSSGLCWGETIYVKPDGTGDAPTIAAALDSAAVGDTLLLASGTFMGEGNRDLAIPDKNLVIVSETGNPDDCVVDFERNFGFRFEEGTAVIKGITMTNAIWSALRVWSYDWTDLRVNDCVFSHCEGDGSAISAICYGEVRIARCKFLSNVGGGCGAVSIDAAIYVQVWIDGCTFCGNTADYGAAITYSTMEVMAQTTNSVFCHNSAAGAGGAIGAGETSANIAGCTFFANSAPVGSAIAGELRVGCARCIIAYGGGGCPVYAYEPLEVGASCTNIYGNEGGDWVGGLADDLGRNGNFSACPSFCNGWTEPYDLHLCSGSSCLPGNHPDGASCGLIGALGQSCDCGPSAAAPTTWGAIKSMYR